MRAAYDLDPGRGTARTMAVAVLGGDVAAGAEPRASPEDVARGLDDLPLDRVDAGALLDGLAGAVGNARYWQEPDGEDVLAAHPVVRAALARVAAAVAQADAASWWDTPLDRTTQWAVTFDDPGRPARPRTGAAAQVLATWRARAVREEALAQEERPADPRATISGQWWSTPPRDLTRTTRSMGSLGPVGLYLVEDAFSWDRASVRPVTVPAEATVYEVDGPEAWADLCRRYPIEMTASRRHDWYRTTGETGRWVLPDWSRAAAEIDAVHLTVAGYLSTAGRAVPVTEDTATVLAGWDPDQTYWLTDVRLTDDARRWVRQDDHRWTVDDV